MSIQTHKGLNESSLSFAGTLAIGLASVAPAYSLAATLGLVVVETGLLAPAAIILGFIPMLLTAYAYRELNRTMPDCGTTFTWVTKAFGPRTGWLSGWVLGMSGIIVLANLAQVASQYTYDLVGADSLAENKVSVTALGVAFIAAMTWVSYRGIEIASWLQNVLVTIQYAGLAVLVGALVWALAGPSRPDSSIDVSLSWFNPLGFFTGDGGGWSALTEGVILVVFIYWGWDTILSLNEETENRAKTPGRAAVVATVLLLATYLLATVASVSYAGVGESGIGLGNEENADDVLRTIGEQALGGWGWVVLLAVLVSAVSSTQTTILPAARGTLAMAVYRALPAKFGHIHPRYQTPKFSTLFVGGLAASVYVALSLLGDNVYDDVLLAIGLMIAFYYGMTAYACVWYFRDDIRGGGRDLWFKGVLPLAGAVMLTLAFFKSGIDMFAADYGMLGSINVLGTEVGSVFFFGVGTILLGLPVMWVLARRKDHRPFFDRETLNADTRVKGSTSA